jgi:hypothetical protein
LIFFKGFFTSLIYFYFNTEIRYEVLRQVQRTILSNDPVQRSTAGETLSTRLSTFRRSISRHRHSSIPNRHERRRTQNSLPSPTLIKPAHGIWWKKCFRLICPCLLKDLIKKRNPLQQIFEQNNLNETSPAVVPEIIVDEDLRCVSSPLIGFKGPIDNDGMTCDTVLMKNDNDDDDLLTDENDVTIQQSSFQGELSSDHTPASIRVNNKQRNRSNSDGYILKDLSPSHFADSKSLR